MRLRWPDSGSLIDSLCSGSSQTSTSGSGSLAGVTTLQLDDALAALQRGELEYVILEDGDRFLQTAGDGDGPYQVQVTEDGGMLHDVDGGTDAATMHRIVRAYLHGDATWRNALWEPPLRD